MAAAPPKRFVPAPKAGVLEAPKSEGAELAGAPKGEGAAVVAPNAGAAGAAAGKSSSS